MEVLDGGQQQEANWVAEDLRWEANLMDGLVSFCFKLKTTGLGVRLVIYLLPRWDRRRQWWNKVWQSMLMRTDEEFLKQGMKINVKEDRRRMSWAWVIKRKGNNIRTGEDDQTGEQKTNKNYSLRLACLGSAQCVIRNRTIFVLQNTHWEQLQHNLDFCWW